MSDNEYTQYTYNPSQQPSSQPQPTTARPGQPQPQQFETQFPSAFSGEADDQGYDGQAYDAPEGFEKPGFIEALLTGSFRPSPLIATVSVLAVGAVLAGAFALSFGGGTSSSDIPVIKAETTAFRTAPTEVGGMDVPNDDSTVFAALRDDAFEAGPGKKVVNLLDPTQNTEKPVEDKLASFEEEAETMLLDSESDEKPSFTRLTEIEPEPIPTKAEKLASAETAATTETTTEVASAETTAPAPVETSKTISVEREQIPATELIRRAEKPESLHSAGSSPETIAFVRSVLDQKDAKEVTAIEPASGGDTATTSAAAPTAGEYYIQLASITSPTAADAEWAKLQKSLTGLSGLSYRVSEANLGAKGTFYRIQAGPLSKASAESICGNIKMQKPGGCLVVK